MKKRLVTLMVAGTLLCSTLAGCGSASDTTTDATPQAQEETVVENVDTSTETVAEEETVVEETTVVETETVVETVEETEVVEEVSFERKDILYPSAVTNFDKYEKTKYAVYCNEQVSSNEYMDLDIMTELYNRGYNIENFVVSLERRRMSKLEKSKERQDNIRAIIGNVVSGSCPLFYFERLRKYLVFTK